MDFVDNQYKKYFDLLKLSVEVYCSQHQNN